MNIIAVDDEQSALNILVRAISSAIPNAVVHSFTKSSSVMEFLVCNNIIPPPHLRI